MKVLGIDPGLATIGFGLVEKQGKGLKCIEYGVIKTPKEEMTPVRLAMIYNEVKCLIERMQPEAIAVEELFFNTNVTTAMRVSQARGVILLCAVQYSGKLFEYTPLQVKQAVSGNGRAQKQQVQFMVRALLGLKEVPKPDDAADALAVAITHSELAKSREVI